MEENPFQVASYGPAPISDDLAGPLVLLADAPRVGVSHASHWGRTGQTTPNPTKGQAGSKDFLGTVAVGKSSRLGRGRESQGWSGPGTCRRPPCFPKQQE